MAITTDSYYNVIYNEETVDRIGLSKTLDNYTIAEIAAMTYCGTEFSMVKNISEREQGVNLVTWDLAKPFVAEDGEHIGNGGKFILSPGNSDYQFPNGMPFNVVWIAFETSYAPPQQLNNEEGMAEHCKIITEFDAPKYVFEMQQPVQRGGIGATSWNTADAPLYDTGLYLHDNNGNVLKYQISDNEFTNALNPFGGCVAPYMFATLNGYTVLVLLCSYNNQWYNRGNGTDSPWVPDGEWTGGGPYINYNWETSFGSSCNVAELYKNSFNGEAIEFPYTWYYSEGYGTEDWGTELDCFGYNDLGEPIEVHFRGEPDDGMGGYRGFTLRTYCKDRDQIYKLIAGGGIKFKTDKIYKPIIESGWVTGYTDDMTTPSELDEWHGSTVHTVTPTPPTPPPPTPEGDDIDDHIMGAGSQLSGIAQLWLLTRAQLIDLHAAFANAPVNYDPMSSFISVMGLGISALRVVGDSMPWTLNPINIRMSNGETWHTGVEGHIVDSQASAFNEVHIKVQKKYNNFLDYSPYATHEIFLPMCGWITLPDIAVDRDITVTYIPDIETLKIRAVVSVVDNSGRRCVVGEKDGVMGAEVPFTNIGHSLFLGNTVVQSADIAGEIVTGAIGAGFTKTNAQGGKFRPYEGFTVGMAGTLPGAIGNALVSGNLNRTHFTTGNGTRVGFGDGENIQIKSTYHRIDKPNNYDHTIGKVCNKTGKLSEFTGFTVCDNPHITFSALEGEKEEIKRLLEQGVIL